MIWCEISDFVTMGIIGNVFTLWGNFAAFEREFLVALVSSAVSGPEAELPVSRQLWCQL